MTTINDANWAFLSEQTGMSAPYNDMYFHYLRSLGYTGTLQDMIAASGLGVNPSGLKNPINNEPAFSLDAFMAAQTDGLYFDTTKLDRFFQENFGLTLADDVGEAMGQALSQRTWNGRTRAQEVAAATERRQDGATTIVGTATPATYNTSTGEGSVSRVDFNNQSGVAFTGLTGGRTYALDITAPSGLLIRDGGLPTGAPLIGASPGRLTYHVLVGAAQNAFSITASAAGGTQTFTVHSIREVAGKHGIQATAGLKPVRQTTGAKFDGSDDYLATSYAAGAGANFIVTLADIPASIAAVQVFAGVNGGANDRFFVGVDTDGLIVGGVGAQSVTTIKGATDRRGQQIVVGLSCDGTTVRLFADDALIYEGAQSGNPNTSLGIWMGATNISGASGNRFGGSIKKLVAGREFLDLATYRNIRHALLAD